MTAATAERRAPAAGNLPALSPGGMPDLTWPLRHAARYYADLEAAADGDVRLTYAQLAERVSRLAAGLASIGVERGTRVALLLPSSYRYLEAHNAIPGLGALVVPLNNRLALAEMREIIEDAGATHLLVDPACAPAAAGLASTMRRVLSVPEEYEALIARSPAIELPGPASPEDPAGLYYTGGTTGRAKGVVLSHRALVAESLGLGLEFRLCSSDRLLLVFPLFHLGGIAGIYIVAWTGGTQVFVPSADPAGILSAIERERVSVVPLAPTVLNAVVAHPAVGTADLSSLRLLVHSAAPISPTLCRRAAQALACSVMQAYGMTEMAGAVTYLHDEQDLLDSPAIASAGVPMPGCEIEVRRTDGSVCEAGEPGEVVLRGASMMSGYWDNPDQTAEVVSGGWYRSGDLGYLDKEGRLYLVDRVKDMIVSGGENVYSSEVENALAAHPAVLEAAVFAIPDEKWGEAVHAAVVLRAGSQTTADELQRFCRERIAGFKTPKGIDIHEEALPRSAAGKILKRELRERFWAGRERRVG